MYFLLCITIFVFSFTKANADNTDLNSTNIAASDIGEAFLNILGAEELKESDRIKELRSKLLKIDGYAVDRDKYSNLLVDTIKQNDFNGTNFYKALIEQDYFQLNNGSKNLYLKLKEKMNRDDVLNILSKRGDNEVVKIARRSMNEGYQPKNHKEKKFEETVDKYLAESPTDDHTFSKDDIFWDPRLEIEERLEEKNKSGRRIFAGERTTIRYYPFVVSVHIMGRFWCGGAIFHGDLIITSASCLQLMHNNRFFRENPASLSVRVGSNHSRVGGERIEALEVYFHPGYNPKTLKCNIALIRLVRHIRFNYHRVPKAIMISTNEGGLPFTTRVLVLGWGVKKTSQKLSIEPVYLQSKYLPVYPNSFCKEAYGDKFVTGSMFCAGTMTTGEGPCDHDAGGPAVLDGKLVGIISFGPAVCGFPDTPTVFTLVGAFSDWIETVNETMPGYYRSRKKTTTTTEDPILRYFATAKHPKPTQVIIPTKSDVTASVTKSKAEIASTSELPNKNESLRSESNFHITNEISISDMKKNLADQNLRAKGYQYKPINFKKLN